MSVSALFGSRIVVAPSIPAIAPSLRTGRVAPLTPPEGRVGLVIECSSRPQKKATAHHRKTRPRKTQPWDIRRKPTVYAPLPPLPSEWTLVAGDTGAESATTTAVDSAQAPPPS